MTPDELIKKIREIKGVEQVEYVISQDRKLYSFIVRQLGDKRFGGSIEHINNILDNKTTENFIAQLKYTLNGKNTKGKTNER